MRNYNRTEGTRWVRSVVKNKQTAKEWTHNTSTEVPVNTLTARLRQRAFFIKLGRMYLIHFGILRVPNTSVLEPDKPQQTARRPSLKAWSMHVHFYVRRPEPLIGVKQASRRFQEAAQKKSWVDVCCCCCCCHPRCVHSLSDSAVDGPADGSLGVGGSLFTGGWMAMTAVRAVAAGGPASLSRFRGALVAAVLGDCVGGEFEGAEEVPMESVLQHLNSLDDETKGNGSWLED